MEDKLWRSLLALRLDVLAPKLTTDVPTYRLLFKIKYREKYPSTVARAKPVAKLGVKLIPPPKAPGILKD
jgi:hypothetical protein